MTDNARQQAKAQLDSIRDMMNRYRNASDDEVGDIEEEIYSDPLDISVRTGWVPFGTEVFEAEEFRILLCTGGPAVQIVGDLDENGGVYGKPRLEYQDWFTPWEGYFMDDDESTDLHDYCSMFFHY